MLLAPAKVVTRLQATTVAVVQQVVGIVVMGGHVRDEEYLQKWGRRVCFWGIFMFQILTSRWGSPSREAMGCGSSHVVDDVVRAMPGASVAALCCWPVVGARTVV